MWGQTFWYPTGRLEADEQPPGGRNHHATFKISLDTQTKLPDQKYTTSNHQVTFKISLDTQTKLPDQKYTTVAQG